MDSTLYKISKEDMKKVAIGLVVALGGALLTYLQDSIPKIDFGSWTPVVVAINSVIVNMGRKFLSDEAGRFLGLGR